MHDKINDAQAGWDLELATAMKTVPFVTCLCPTYLRPRLLENAIACFERQDYPADRRRLIILDDAAQLGNLWCESGSPHILRLTGLGHDDVPRVAGLAGWRVYSFPERFPDLPSKYNTLVRMETPPSHEYQVPTAAVADIYLIWEDDDVYLPWYISAHVKAMQPPLADCWEMRDGKRVEFKGEVSCLSGTRWSKPSRVLSTYTGQPEQEDASGRFFASIAVTAGLWKECGGIVPTKRADFDQQSLARFAAVGGQPADPLEFSPKRTPGYCFRFGTTGQYHGQHTMRSPDDETWYDRLAGAGDAAPQDRLIPRLDEETQRIYAAFRGSV